MFFAEGLNKHIMDYVEYKKRQLKILFDKYKLIYGLRNSFFV